MRGMLGVVCGLGLLGACWVGVIGMSPDDSVAGGRAGEPLPPIPQLANYTVQRLDLPQDGREDFGVVVELGGNTTALTLRPHSMRSSSYRLMVQGEDGELHEEQAPPPATYRGTVDGIPGSRVAGSLIDGQLTASVYIPGEGLYDIMPLEQFVTPAAHDEHIVYHKSDVLLQDYHCGTDDIEQPKPAEGSDDDGGIAGTGFKVCDIACDADGEFYQLNGSSVTNTVFDIENVMNGVEAIYEAEVGIAYEVTYIIVWTNPGTDPYSSNNAGTLLDQTRAHWNANNRDVQRDIAQMYTGKNINGGVIGIAWLSQICANVTNGMGYSVVESRFTSFMTNRVCLSAHELGHNWSAGHCDGQQGCAIMCSGLGGCGGGCTTFGPNSTNSINSFKNSRTCLSDLADPIDLPFSDAFPSTTLNTSLWSYNNDGTVNSNALGEPSGSFSLNLDAGGPDPFEDDEVRSNFIRLEGATSVTLSYFTEHRGVESGEELVVEYWNDNLTWVEINRVTSNGVDQSSFDFHTYNLTGDALHDEFRVRFRTEVNETNDEWYVDDVLVDGIPVAQHDLTIAAGPFVSAVSITVSPADRNGLGDGLTPFVRTYNEGTSVTLTAPASHSGMDFHHWEIDGAQVTTSTALNFAVTADVTAEARYLPDVDLMIESLPDSGVLVLVDPLDNNLQGTGITPFTRTYTLEDVVTLTAVPEFNGRNFSHWTVGGVDQPAGQSVVDVTIDGPITATTNYADGTAVEATLLSIGLPVGTQTGGGLAELEDSDDAYATFEPEIVAPNKHVVDMVVHAGSPFTTVSRLDVTVETSTNRTKVVTKIYLNDRDASTWVQLDKFLQPRADTVSSFPDVPNPNAYVRDSDGRIRVRLFARRGAVNPFVYEVDHVELMVTP